MKIKYYENDLHENLDLLHVHYAIPHAFAALAAKQILASQGISLPIITEVFFLLLFLMKIANALPMFRKSSSFTSSGKIPRMSYALKTSSAFDMCDRFRFY